jgi:hypothetical protein
MQGAIELHPIMVVRETLGELPMMHVPFADEEIEIMRVVGGGVCGYGRRADKRGGEEYGCEVHGVVLFELRSRL